MGSSFGVEKESILYYLEHNHEVYNDYYHDDVDSTEISNDESSPQQKIDIKLNFYAKYYI